MSLGWCCCYSCYVLVSLLLCCSSHPCSEVNQFCPQGCIFGSNVLWLVLLLVWLLIALLLLLLLLVVGVGCDSEDEVRKVCHRERGGRLCFLIGLVPIGISCLRQQLASSWMNGPCFTIFDVLATVPAPRKGVPAYPAVITAWSAIVGMDTYGFLSCRWCPMFLTTWG